MHFGGQIAIDLPTLVFGKPIEVINKGAVYVERFAFDANKIPNS